MHNPPGDRENSNFRKLLLSEKFCRRNHGDGDHGHHPPPVNSITSCINRSASSKCRGWPCFSRTYRRRTAGGGPAVHVNLSPPASCHSIPQPYHLAANHCRPDSDACSHVEPNSLLSRGLSIFVVSSRLLGYDAAVGRPPCWDFSVDLELFFLNGFFDKYFFSK